MSFCVEAQNCPHSLGLFRIVYLLYVDSFKHDQLCKIKRVLSEHMHEYEMRVSLFWILYQPRVAYN